MKTQFRFGSLYQKLQFQGNGAAPRYETNVNVCPNKEHVSTMEVKSAVTSRVRVNTSPEDQDDVQPEDFEFVSHPTLLMDGMNDLRTKDHLLDIKLWAEGRCFRVRGKDFTLIGRCRKNT